MAASPLGPPPLSQRSNLMRSSSLNSEAFLVSFYKGALLSLGPKKDPNVENYPFRV